MQHTQMPVQQHAPRPPMTESARGETSEGEELLETLRELPQEDAEADRLRGRIVEIYRPAALREARRYRNRGVENDELDQIASVGLMKAIHGFDPGRGGRFLSYLLPTVSGELKRHFRDNLWAVHAPRSYRDRRAELNGFIVDFIQRRYREPTQKEIGAHFGMNAKTTGEFLNAASSYSALSLDVPYGADNEDHDVSLGSRIGQDDRDLNHVVEKETLKYAVGQLPVRQRRIVVLRYFEELTQARIAEHVGCSQMQVSRLLSASMSRMRATLLDEG